jgi:hypothetical protein
MSDYRVGTAIRFEARFVAITSPTSGYVPAWPTVATLRCKAPDGTISTMEMTRIESVVGLCIADFVPDVPSTDVLWKAYAIGDGDAKCVQKDPVQFKVLPLPF